MFEDISGYFNLSLFLVGLAVILFLWLYQSNLLPADFPPGPTPMPIFGNLLMIKKKDPLQRHVTLYELSKIHGPIFGLRMGSLPTVVLSDYDVIEEALVKKEDAFTRPHNLPVLLRRSVKNGELTSFWKSGPGAFAFRDFAQRYFFENGRTKESLENRLRREAEMFCVELSEHTGNPFSVKQLNKDATMNVLYQNVFGSRLDYKDKALATFTHEMDIFADSKHFGSLLNFVPPLKYIFGRKVYAEIDKNLEDLDNFTEDQINKHKKIFNQKMQNDLIDQYLQEHEEREAPSLEDFQRMILDLNCGNYSIYGVLDWLWLLLASYPSIQRQCQDEIDQYFAKKRNDLKFSDQDKLPFVHATILETLRFVTPVPFSVPYATVKDVMISGYKIPQDTFILVSLYSIHRNEKYWTNPDQFKPERWLRADGSVDSNKYAKNSKFVPFGIGRKSCLARKFAETALFIFFVTVLKKFNLALVDPQNPPSLVGELFFLLEPKPYKLIVTPR